MSPQDRIDLEEIRALIRLATEAEIAELSVDAPHVKVRIRTNSAPRPEIGTPPPKAAAAGAPVTPAAAGYITITAPMVGTFYRSPKPDMPPFVTEGDHVEAGQTVCILEAMKMFNEIQSEISGRIARILVENGVPVEYGQVLFLVDPASAS
jgi:acetyl-CoA carboxylase biotin carboxyl carrier protein